MAGRPKMPAPPSCSTCGCAYSAHCPCPPDGNCGCGKAPCSWCGVTKCGDYTPSKDEQYALLATIAEEED